MVETRYNRALFHAPTLLVGACCVLLDFIILGVCLKARTSLPLISPWDVLPLWIFGLYAAATVLLAYGTRFFSRAWQTLFLLVHACTTWGTVALIYRLGFGFDPFIHQAAEQHLVTHGSISLTTPLYVGQYGLVWLLQKLSGLSVLQIDHWLVPVLSLGLIPLLQRQQRWLPVTLFLLPLSWFSFTIPFHLGLLFFICTLCLSENTEPAWTRWILGICAVLCLLIHPLIGIPCAVFVSGLFLEKTRWKQLSVFVPVFGIPLSLLGAMAVYAATQHASLSLPSLQSIQISLIALLGTPYHLSLEAIPLSILYGFLSLWPFALCLIGLQENLLEQTPWKKYRLATGIGFFVAAIVLACFIRLPDIIAHEQFEFPLRLLHIVPLFFLPDLALFLERFFSQKQPHPRLHALSVSLVLCLVATTQWFASYPQQNAIVHRFAPSVSLYEYDAINWIEQERQGQPFVVLSHQMLGAAALQSRGFEQTVTTCHGTHLSYAIPTGGALYQDFLTLLRTHDLPKTLEHLSACYGDARLFVVVPTYWDKSGAIRNRLLPIVQSQTSFGEHLTVFAFPK